MAGTVVLRVTADALVRTFGSRAAPLLEPDVWLADEVPQRVRRPPL